MFRQPFRRLGVGATVLLSLVMLACGGDSRKGAPTSGGVATTPAISTPIAGMQTPAPGAEADLNATLRFAFGTNGGSNYDPHTAANPFVNTFLYPAYDSLIALTPDGKFEPQLAEAYTFKEGGKVMELKLRRDVVFHDGTPFNAEAVKANLERAKNHPRSTLKADMTPVEAVDIVDPYTVNLRLTSAAGSLPALLADRMGMMVSPAALNNPNLDVKPVGAGPYRVVDHQPGKVIVYERFDRYWNPSVQKLRRIEISMVLDPATRLRALRSGEIDATALNADQIREAERANLKVTTDPYAGSFILYLNTSRSELKNQKARQAIAMAINRQAINEAFHAGKCPPTAQVFPTGYWANNPNVKADFHKYDPAAAKRLLAEAGLPNGFSFSTVVINVPFYSSQAEAVQQQLAEVGIKMEVQTLEPAQLLTRFAIEKSADAYYSTTGGFVDPAKTVAQLYLPNSTLNPGGYDNPRISELAFKGLEPTDQAQRAPFYQEISRIAAEDVLHVPICSGMNVTATTAKVQVIRSNLTGAYDLRYAWMAK
ncbi:MAG: hypothetical protein C4346_16780 [Chloroflexota bacterium]